MMRFSITAVTSLAVLLSSLVGLAGHEHASEVLRTAATCFVDHDQHETELAGEVDQAHPEHRVGVTTAGSEHEHRCVACHLGRDRFADAELPVLLDEPRVTGFVWSASSLWTPTSELPSLQARGPPLHNAS